MENGKPAHEHVPLEQSISNESEKRMLPDEEQEEEVEDKRVYMCGLGGWRPSWLQPMANLKFFTFSLSMLMVFGSMNFTYYIAVLTQIEREYGLSSTMTGFIKNLDNIGYMASVLLVTHFCRYANKPRLLSGANMLSAVAVFLFAAPYFIYGSNDPANIELSHGNETVEGPNLCVQANNLDDPALADQCGAKKNPLLRPFNAGALAFFVVSELIQGICSSPKYALTITFMDDNARKTSPAYFGQFQFS